MRFISPYDKKEEPKRKRTNSKKYRIAQRQGWKCNRCDKELPYPFNLDHIIPLAENGNDDEGNLQALCSNCHTKKTEEDRIRAEINKVKPKKSTTNDKSKEYWNKSIY